jgi:hypothetical protein
MMTAGILDTIRELGGELVLDGGKLRYRLPDCPEAREVLEQVRQDRDAIKAFLRDGESEAPSLEEVWTALPRGVRLVSYQPRKAPFAVAPVSVVTDAGKFYRAYLTDLRRRLEHRDRHAAPPLPDILAKLAEGGLVLVTDDDFQFGGGSVRK